MRLSFENEKCEVRPGAGELDECDSDIRAGGIMLSVGYAAEVFVRTRLGLAALFGESGILRLSVLDNDDWCECV